MSYRAENITNGRKVVAVSNTALAIAPSARSQVVFITALPGNSTYIVVGGTGLVFSPATSTTGKILYAGDSITIEIDDVSKIFINGTANDGVTFAYTS